MQSEYTTDEYGDQHKVDKPLVNFNITDAALAELAERHKDVDAYKDFEVAKSAAKECQKLRVKLTEAHKKEKAEALAYGRMLDAEKRRIMNKIILIEDPIKAQIEEIKTAEERKEAERVAGITAKIDEMEALVMDRFDMSIEEMQKRFDAVMAIEITTEVYEEFVEHAQLTKEDAETKLRIAINRERDRLEEKARLEEQRKENEAKEATLAKEREEFEAEKRKAVEEQAAKDAEAQAERQAELDKQAKEQAEKQAEIDAEKERFAKIAFEEQVERDRKAAEKLAAQQAPDAEKLEVFADEITELSSRRSVMQSDRGYDILLEAVDDLTMAAAGIRAKIERMK